MKWFAALVFALPGWLFADELVIVTMPTCPPCRALKRDLLQRPDITAGHTIRLLEGKAAMQTYKVDLVPTIIRMRDGRQVARKVGHDGVNGLKAWLDAR
jgi:thiol-disulfide isomerase/thioredoxin